MLAGVESLGALREAVGTQALHLYLAADAVATGGMLELPPHRRDYATFVEGLPANHNGDFISGFPCRRMLRHAYDTIEQQRSSRGSAW